MTGLVWLGQSRSG